MLEYLSSFKHIYIFTIMYFTFTVIFMYQTKKEFKKENRKTAYFSLLFVVGFFGIFIYLFGQDLSNINKIKSGEKTAIVTFESKEEIEYSPQYKTPGDIIIFYDNDKTYIFENEYRFFEDKFTGLTPGNQYKITYYDFHLLKSVEPLEKTKSTQ